MPGFLCAHERRLPARDKEAKREVVKTDCEVTKNRLAILHLRQPLVSVPRSPLAGCADAGLMQIE